MTTSALRTSSRRSTHGFSMIEMMISSVLFLALSTASYQVMKVQRGRQMASLEQQKKSNASGVALDRFKSDARMIDPNWSNLGLAAIFPHQGYGFGGNAYLDTTLQSAHGISDGVTFLRRHPQFDQAYEVVLTFSGQKVCIIADGLLQSHIFRLNNVENLEVNDWLLVYQEGHQFLALVDSLVGNNDVKIRFPGNAFLQESAVSAQDGSSHLTSFVVAPGVRPTDFDHTGLQTPTTVDNDLCLTTASGRKIVMQKLYPPVSYVMAYVTNDGLEKSASNTYLLNSRGNKRTALTRIEHDAIRGQQREYIADVDQLALTFDIKDSDDGGIIRDVGRDAAKQGLLFVGMPNATENETEFFFTNSDISSINLNAMLMLPDTTDPARVLVQNHKVKATFGAALGQNLIAESMHVESQLSANLNVFNNPSPYLIEQVGKPLYVTGGASLGGEMLIPVSRMILGDPDQIPDIKELQDDGRIKVLNPQGEDAITEADSSIVFYTQIDANKIKKTFYPNSIQTIDRADGSKVLLVGGVSVEADVTQAVGEDSEYVATMVRRPGVAMVTIPANTSIAQYLAGNHQPQELNGQGETTKACNIPNCKWIGTDSGHVDTFGEGLLDTANVALDRNDNMIIVPMTKENMADSSHIYKVSRTGNGWDGNVIQHLSTIPDSGSGRVISSIANRTIVVAGAEEYLPVCISKPMPICENMENPETCRYYGSDGNVLPPSQERFEMGQIRLMRVGGSIMADSIFLANHNYACSSMTLNENNDLLVSGRLTIHAIAEDDMKKAVMTGTESGDTEAFERFKGLDNQLLLDDIAMVDEGGVNVYADGFIVDPTSYSGQEAQKVGWRGGTSVAEFDDGTFGVLSANTVRTMENAQSLVAESINVGIHKVTLPNMKERVVANIQTDAQNINNTRVIATYLGGGSFEDHPTTYIPGNYFVNSTPRHNPTAMPGVMATMSSADWIHFYRELNKPRSETINQDMPILNLSTGQTVECEAAFVDTCAY